MKLVIKFSLLALLCMVFNTGLYSQIIGGPEYNIYYTPKNGGSQIVLQSLYLNHATEGAQLSSSGSITVPLFNADECGSPLRIQFTDVSSTVAHIAMLSYNDVAGQPSVGVIQDPTDTRPYGTGSTYVLNNSGQVIFRIVLYDDVTNVSTIWFFTLTVHYDNQFNISASSPTICPGGSVSLSLGNSYYNTAQQIYVLGDNNPGIAMLWADPSKPFVVSSAGTYYAYYATAYCNSNSVSITAAPATASITPNGPLTFCSGGSVTLTASANSSYLWSNGVTSQSITVTSSGSYSVTVTNAAGCTATSAATVVTVNPLPPVTIAAGGPTTFCQGGTVTLTAAPGYSYTWSNGANSSSITTGIAGNYTVSVTNSFGCSAVSAPITITVLPSPTPQITAGGPTVFCPGDSVTLTSAPASSYSWNTGATTQSITVNTGGFYSLGVTDANGCSGTIRTGIIVTLYPSPSTTISASGPTTFCVGGSVTLTAPTNASYLWSDGSTTQSIVPITAGAYSVTVTDGNSCKATSVPVTVTINNPTPVHISVSTNADGSVTLSTPVVAGCTYSWNTGETTASIVKSKPGLYQVNVTNSFGCTSLDYYYLSCVAPKPTITASGNTAICSGSSVTLTASTGTSYAWSTGETTQSITTATPGSYSVQVGYSKGCANVSDATFVFINPLPAAVITPILHSDGSIILTASGGASYTWSSGESSVAITKSVPSLYSVTVTDSYGCSSVASYTLQDNGTTGAGMLVVIPGGSTSICAGDLHTLTASAGGDNYIWNTGITNTSISINAGGVYTVSALYSGSHKIERTSVNVMVNPLPTPRISASLNVNGSVTLTATGGTSYVWSSGETTPDISKSSAGSYIVTVSNATGCSAVTSYSIQDNGSTGSGSLTITPSGPTTFCTGGSVTLTAAKGADSYLWSTGATTSSITVTTGGTFTVSAVYGSLAQVEKASLTVEVRDDLPTLYPSGQLILSPADTVGFGAEVTASAAFQNAQLYSWDFGDGVTAPGIPDSSLLHYYYTAGKMTITVSALSKYHCLLTMQASIAIGKEAKKDTILPVAGNYQVNIFPNPFKDHLYLTCWLEKAQPVAVEVFTANGKFVTRHNFSGQVGDNKFQFTSIGTYTKNVLYLFRVFFNDGKIFSDKMLSY